MNPIDIILANPPIIGYALLSLTLIRMVPASLTLLGTRLRPAAHLFLGWFGPRGIATIILALLVLEESGLPEAEMISGVAVVTVLFGILLHGITACPLSSLYANVAAKDHASARKRKPTGEMPTRFGGRRGRRKGGRAFDPTGRQGNRKALSFGYIHAVGIRTGPVVLPRNPLTLC